MNRNVESHFAELPQVDIQRSIFDRSSAHKTSFNVGQLIPFYVDEVLPGDTFKVKTSCVVRLQTPLTPIMDNIYMDTYFFFVPNRLVWTHWKEFMGENTASAWIPQTEYSVPRIINPEHGFPVGSIADYMGIPPLVESSVSAPTKSPIALPFRAYALICNEWFRDQNLTDPLVITTSDSDLSGASNLDGNYRTTTERGGKPFMVAKYHDYFTSCLPAPQKGPDVSIIPSVNVPTINHSMPRVEHFAPVITRDATIDFRTIPMGLSSTGSAASTTSRPLKVINDEASSSNPNVTRTLSGTGVTGLYPDNLWADLSAAGVSVNELRQAFQLQKYYEKNARAGSRYREILKEHFGVVSSDARMQIPEYLGGHRFPLSIHQVANQSQGDADFLGDLGAMSNTSDIHDDFVRSFEEHGFVLGLCCVRYDHSYPQGLERFWQRRSKFDYYFPVFANLGEQRVFCDEIYWSGRASDAPVTYGYQEAWAEYRYKPSRVSGEMRPGITNSLATWHLADYYTQQPVLSDEWIREDKSNIDRVLSVSSSVANQVFADFYVQNIATRPMPMYSIPGLADHH